MLVSGELYLALRQAGAADESASAAAAVLATHELRLRKLEETLRWAAIPAIFVIGAFVIGALVIALATR